VTPPRKIAAILLAAVAGAVLIAIVVYSATRPSGREIPKVIIGNNDAVYYSHAATQADAEMLGRGLQRMGFFNDRGKTPCAARRERRARSCRSY
jgi:hypothetical protein